MLMAVIGQQGPDVLDREAGVGAVEPDGWVVVRHPPLVERLGVLGHRGRRPANDVGEESIENERGLVGKVLEVLVHITVEDREEAYVVVLKRHKVGEMQRPQGVRRFMPLVSHHGPRHQLHGKGLQPGLEGHVREQEALRGVARKTGRPGARLDVLDRSVLVSEIRIQRLADMVLQPFDHPVGVIGHGRGGGVVHVLEDGVEHRARNRHEPLDMVVDFAVNVRDEQELLVALDHETGEMHRTQVVLGFGQVGHQRGQLFGQRLGVGWARNGEVDDQMALAHSVLLSIRALPSGRRQRISPMRSCSAPGRLKRAGPAGVTH